MSGVADLFRCPPSHTEAATWAPPNWPHWVAPQLRSTKKLCRSENFREPHALTRSPSPSYLPLPTELASGRAGGSRAHACGTAKVPGGKIILCGPVLSVSYGATTTTSEVLCGTLFWSVTGAVGGRKAGTCHTKSCRAGIRSVGWKHRRLNHEQTVHIPQVPAQRQRCSQAWTRVRQNQTSPGPEGRAPFRRFATKSEFLKGCEPQKTAGMWSRTKGKAYTCSDAWLTVLGSSPRTSGIKPGAPSTWSVGVG